jgi:lysophospholipase L1-like esterase
MTPLPRPNRTTGGVAALLMLMLALAGCSSDGSQAASNPTPSAPSPTVSTSAAGTDDPKYPLYVALGDSYTAAPLVPDTDVSNGCLRSTNNYPALVAAGLPGTRLLDVSCSSASSTSLVGVQRTNGGGVVPPQFDALTEDTDLVTVGIGGNDFRLFATLIGDCARLRASDPTGSPCKDRLTAGGTDRLKAELRQIRTHITAIVKGIRDRSPKARVLVVGYPQILPAKGTCPALLPLATGDVAYARTINKGLAAALEQGAKAARGEFVDLFHATAGHDICADHPWINGRYTDTKRALAFHPFAAEQKKAADLVLATLDRPAHS